MAGYSNTFIDVINNQFQAGTITVGTTEILASINGSSNLSGRQEITIFNSSANTIYYGPTGVSTSTGIPIEAGETVSLQYGEFINVYLIAATAGNSTIIHEAS